MYGLEDTKLLSRLDRRLTIEDVRPVCRGMARATQVLSIGDDAICTDEILIEEISYPLPDDMNAELNSLSIKIGMFSPFYRTSTYPPKYYITERSTAMLVTSVPPVSLAMVLSEIEHRFPAHYTWDRIAYIRDIAKASAAGIVTAWRQRKTPRQAIESGLKAARGRMPDRISPHERLQLAALLVDAVRPKHAAGLYHNNITPHTVYFTDGTTPKVLCNYGGIVPPVMEEYVPHEVLRPQRDTTLGEQSADTYALALIAFELITGKRLPGPRPELDPDPTTEPHEQPEDKTSQMPRPLSNLVKLGHKAAARGRRLWEKLRATWDESRYAHFRMLTRASGSVVRSIPFLRCVLDIWFPTDTAWAIRAILDANHNERLFGPTSRVNRWTKLKRNANTAFLRAALPSTPLQRTSRPARLIDELIDRVQQLPRNQDDELDDVKSTWLGRSTLTRYATTAVTLILFAALSIAHDTALGRMEGTAVRLEEQEEGRSNGRCDARLVQDTLHPGVYRIVDMRRRCELDRVTFAPMADENISPPPSLGQTYARLYLSRMTDTGYTPSYAIRRCPSEERGCEEGQFYRSVGLSGLGEKIRFRDNDVVAFDEYPLERFLRRVEEAEEPD